MIYLGLMEIFIEKMQDVGYRVEMVTKSKKEMIHVAVGVERKRVESPNKYEPEYHSKVQFDEVKVRHFLGKKMSDRCRYLYALLYAPKVSAEMFELLKPVLQKDETHCSNHTK